MNAPTSLTTFGVTSSGAEHLLSIVDTKWGFIIRSDTQFARRAVLIERVAAMAGLAVLAVACGSWFLPEVPSAVDTGPAGRLISTVALATPALAFLWVSERGLAREAQVDIVKSRLRLTLCNRRGKSRAYRIIPFDKIASAYVKPGNDRGDASQLFVRHADTNEVVHVASGRETTLRRLHERLSRELRPVQTQLQGWERVGRKLQPSMP
ncbi:MULTISPECIES: hypothetical protein [Actibacterium]|uniref:Uncharacterized protein n=1 Tax=Actibacterium naphthalenivorans TaxID=1614693 RepID=A0A840CEU1_9RHOB|nr:MULTISPECIES: hypothetical protein [Actibacterium]ALG90143.1 hypothetical protein TQ29_08060 [Actibacterium sp. EMB200-NS6]MBB4022028.1 hypothetical protein [Actibacterium naphthalenivorans]